MFMKKKKSMQASGSVRFEVINLSHPTGGIVSRYHTDDPEWAGFFSGVSDIEAARGIALNKGVLPKGAVCVEVRTA